MKSILHEATKWSAQRIGTLNSCNRKYRFRYLMKGGWTPNADDELQQIYRLSLLQTESAFVGTLIHKAIRKMIAAEIAGISLEVEQQADAACREFSFAVENGATLPLDKISRRRSKFLRQERGIPITPEEISRWHGHIRHCLATWKQHAATKELLAKRSHIVRKFLDPEKPVYTEALGVPSFLKTDAIVHTENAATVYDWKTGSPAESDARQAAIYDTFVRSYFKLKDETAVKVKLIYLPNGSEQVFSFDPEERAELLWQIGEEFTDLRITNADPSARHFPPRPSRQCRNCPFQFICKEGQQQVAKLTQEEVQLWN